MCFNPELSAPPSHGLEADHKPNGPHPRYCAFCDLSGLTPLTPLPFNSSKYGRGVVRSTGERALRFYSKSTSYKSSSPFSIFSEWEKVASCASCARRH